MDKELELLDLASGMYEGEQLTGLLCPFCKSTDKAFSMKRDGDSLLFICYRASCGAKGRLRTRSKAAKAAIKKQRTYVVGDTIPQEHIDYLKSKYLLSDQAISRAELGWTTHYSQPEMPGRLYIPCLDYTGKQRGYIARDLYKQQQPKSLTFRYREDSPTGGWYWRGAHLPVVIVEDAISAMRVSDDVNSYYLNGTNITDNDLNDLIRVPSSKKYLCLDKDATKKAISMALKLKSKIKLHVVPLTKDIKDLSEEEYEEFIKCLDC